jgi:DNA-binding NarL/FixJ family response regulator
MRVLVADDHAAMRQSLVQALETEPDLEVVVVLRRVRLSNHKQLHPDVILMDIGCRSSTESRPPAESRESAPQVRVIRLSA